VWRKLQVKKRYFDSSGEFKQEESSAELTKLSSVLEGGEQWESQESYQCRYANIYTPF
jgi:hypothetical protein